MTLLQAANQAHARNCKLVSTWNPITGLRVMAVPLEQSK